MSSGIMVKVGLFGLVLVAAVLGCSLAIDPVLDDLCGDKCTDDPIDDILDIWENVKSDDDDDDDGDDGDSSSSETSSDSGGSSETSSEGVLRRKRSLRFDYNDAPLAHNYHNFPKAREGDYRAFKYYLPKPTYHRAFSEGKWHLNTKQLIKNYYKKGTYQLAKKYFIALPFVKIIPVKQTTSVDYVGYLQTYNKYRVRLCERCYHGGAQIEFRSDEAPFKNVIRRFNFLPNTKRTKVEYGSPKIVQTGPAQFSQNGRYHRA